MGRVRIVIAASILYSAAFSPSPASAATIAAASCSLSDVSNSVNAAASGDVVAVPAGSCTWTATLTITKSITLQGSGIGQTVITDSVANSPLINWTLTDTGLSRITGFEFLTSSSATKDWRGQMAIQGTSRTFRFDHNRAVPRYATALVFRGYVRGVVDNNTFDLTQHDVNSAPYALSVYHDNWGGVGSYGDNSWAQPAPLGTADALYVEDNTCLGFWRGSMYIAFIDGWNGERVVIRHNSITDAGIHNHGTETPGRERSARSFEIYENDISYTGADALDAIAIRGGSGVVYNNRITGTVSGGIEADYLREHDFTRAYFTWGWAGQVPADTITRSGSIATVTCSAGCGVFNSPVQQWVKISGANQLEYNGTFLATYVSWTQFTFTVPGSPASPATGRIRLTSPFDQNSDTHGYHCIDQPGAGTGDLLSGSPPAVPAWPNQGLDPFYVWGNTKNGSPITLNSHAPDVIVPNRDYYDAVKPGYTPYPYPHPLTGGQSAQPPRPPTNVIVK